MNRGYKIKNPVDAFRMYRILFCDSTQRVKEYFLKLQ